MRTKLVPETEHYIKHIKIYLQSFVYIYHFYQLQNHAELMVHH